MTSETKRACDSCQWPLYKASGFLRCLEKRFVVRCSSYVGPFREYHINLPYGPAYSDALSRKKGRK